MQERKTCKNCNVLLKGRQQKFCSDACSIKYWVKTHPEERNRWMRQDREKLKSEVFELLGNKCANPYNLNHGDFLTDRRSFQIDHVKGGGTRQKLISIHRSKGRNGYLRMVRKDLLNGSKDYQLLCANCNQIKRIEQREDYKWVKHPRKEKKND